MQFAQTKPIRLEERQKSFMVSFDMENHQQKREKFLVQLRKSKRQENYSVRRSRVQMLSFPSEILFLNPHFEQLGVLEQLDYLGNLLLEGPPHLVLSALQALRSINNSMDLYSIRIMLNKGIINLILNYTDLRFSDQITSEALWIICNISAGDDLSTCLANMGMLELCLNSISESRPLSSENAIWTLANLIADDESTREVALREFKLHDFLVSFLQKVKHTLPIVKVIAFALSNLSKGSYKLQYSVFESFMYAFKQLLTYTDTQILYDSLTGISHLISEDHKRCQSLINYQLVPKMLGFTHPKLEFPILKIMGHISSGEEKQTDYILHQGLLNYLLEKTQSKKSKVRRSAYWVLSNIAAGNFYQRIQFLEHSILDQAVQGLNDTSYSVRKEVSYVFSNLGFLCSQDEILKLCSSELFESIEKALHDLDPKLVLNILGFIKAVLDSCDLENTELITSLLAETECINSVESLNAHRNAAISSFSKELCKTYYELVSDTDEEVQETLEVFDFS